MEIDKEGSYVISNSCRFTIRANDVLVTADNGGVATAKILDDGPAFLIEGNNIKIEGLVFDLDFRDRQDSEASATGILATNCHNLEMTDCRIIVRIPYLVGNDPEKEGPVLDNQGDRFIGMKVLDSQGVVITRCLMDFRQTLPDGTEVRHVIGVNGSRLYVNGLPIVVPRFGVQEE